MKQRISVALAGNPNSGKTTIFNALTGARQHVGNYPGVTVEYKEGFCRHGEFYLQIFDLPGTYSLSAYSAEELLARNFIINDKPDLVVDILDASNLERNLYLAVQLIELQIPLVLVFNMSDLARARGFEFDLVKLASFFGARIVETVGHKGVGMKDLLDAIVLTATDQRVRSGAGCAVFGAEQQLADADLSDNGSEVLRQYPPLTYGRQIEQQLDKIEGLLRDNKIAPAGYSQRWLALKLLENDSELRALVDNPELEREVEHSISQIETLLGERPESAVAGARYGFISGACQEAVRLTAEARHNISDKIDTVLTSRIVGLPFFLALMYLTFHLTFTVGAVPMEWIEQLFGWLGGFIGGLWPAGSSSALKSLLIDGVIGGVGGVVIFLPNIVLLFLAIGFLEDSGYMARAAFLMDQMMHRIGLHGKSFIPMLIGFGCSVPAILATRTLENRRDRLTTMLVIPLMSCGARLPIYALIIPAFFPSAWHAPMLWIIYVIGILLAIVLAKLLRSTILKGETVPFVMELPPYRLPTLRGIVTQMGERSWIYLKKAGTIILGLSILLWALTTYPSLPDQHRAQFEAQRIELQARADNSEALNLELARIEASESEAAVRNSFAGRIGRGLEPLLKPMGFDWKIGTALIGAFAAKEVFVAQMGIVYAIGSEQRSDTLRERLRKDYSPLVGFCIMVFCLIGAPCMATIAVTRHESNSWRWALLQLGGLTIIAYIVTVFIYQAGSLLKIGI